MDSDFQRALDLVLNQKIKGNDGFRINEIDPDTVEVYKLGEVYLNGVDIDRNKNGFITEYSIVREENEIRF